MSTVNKTLENQTTIRPNNSSSLLVWLAAVVIVLLIAIAPLYLSSYWTNVAVLFFIAATSTLGYRFITTMGGWSFAHLAVMGLGAYAMALLMAGRDPAYFWLSLFVAPLCAGLFALLIAYPVLRTRHYYFFLSTFAAGEALRQCFIQFKSITGGSNGISFIQRPSSILGLNFVEATHFYILVVVVFFLVLFMLSAIEISQVGRSIKAVARNEELAASLGIDALYYRTLAFVVGSMVAGLAGALYGNYNGIINPLDFRTLAMFKLVAAVIVGGRRTPFGCLLGLTLLTAVEELFRAQPQYVPLVWGLLVISVLMFNRDGLEAVFASVVARIAGLGVMGNVRH